MITTLIFDCFGVLYHGARSYALDHAAAEDRQRLNELFDQADYGILTTRQFVEQAAELMGIAREEFEALLLSQYRRNDALVGVLEGLRRRYKVGLLSNVNDTLIRRLFSDDELERFFDEVVMSSSVGMVKPHPEIFELMAAHLGVTPEECLMIDDTPANIDGARAIGMEGVVCQSTEQCLHELRSHGIKV